ncbi:MAG: hypothetical protein ACR2L2_10535 [Acidobacteriota bacterium]
MRCMVEQAPGFRLQGALRPRFTLGAPLVLVTVTDYPYPSGYGTDIGGTS